MWVEPDGAGPTGGDGSTQQAKQQSSLQDAADVDVKVDEKLATDECQYCYWHTAL